MVDGADIISLVDIPIGFVRSVHIHDAKRLIMRLTAMASWISSSCRCATAASRSKSGCGIAMDALK